MANRNRSSELAAVLRHQIATMRTGERLPGVRELSAQFQASAATVSSALSELVALGLVTAEPGRGTFVSQRAIVPEPDFSWQSQALGPVRVDADRSARLGMYGGSDRIRLSWGYLSPELLPHEELRRISSQAARSTKAWAMTPPSGSPDLRRVFASEYRADPSDVLIVSGGQQGLVFAMRTLAEPGSVVITESPTYPGAILAAQSAGLRLASVPSDHDGILVDKLEDELERTRARIIYLQPSFANPTGAVLSSSRRRAVLELAQRHGAFIIEDDWARHLAFDGAAPPSMFTDDPDGHVVSVMTLSKPASPGLRLGAVIARGPAGDRLRAARAADDLCVSPIVQETALGLLTSSHWPRHLKRLRTALLTRRDVMLDALCTTLPDLRVPLVPRGGIHVWARLPQGSSPREISVAAYAAGVIVGDGQHFFVDEPPAAFLRFSFGSATQPEMLEGLRRLASTMEEQAPR